MQEAINFDECFTRTCTVCKELKPLTDFHRASSKALGRQYQCKVCTKAKQDELRHTQEWKAKHAAYNKRKADERQARTGTRASVSKEQKRASRLMKKGYSKEEAWKLATTMYTRFDGAGRAKLNLTSEEATEYDLVTKRNARDAWRHWISVKASDEWMARYYAASGSPWNNPRLTSAEMFRIRYQTDPVFNMRQRFRAHFRRMQRKDKVGELIRQALKNNRKSPTAELLLGYTMDDLKIHLERQFTKGMTWQKYNEGHIHIDHILPISSFDIKEVGDAEWKACWAITNLRPMWGHENIKKSNKVMHII
jgi:hypothetical protein